MCGKVRGKERKERKGKEEGRKKERRMGEKKSKMRFASGTVARTNLYKPWWRGHIIFCAAKFLM